MADDVLREVYERIHGYVTALMVDDRSVAGCERAMDEALDALAARLAEAEKALREAISEATAGELWVCVPHEQWRNLLASLSATTNEDGT